MSKSQDKSDLKNKEEKEEESGEFKRAQTNYRDKIENNKNAKYPAEENRYLLYVSLTCPWASRTLFVRNFFGLEKCFDVVIVNSKMERTRPNDKNDKHEGWVFPTKKDEHEELTSPDPIFDARYIRDIYEIAGTGEPGRYSVPVLLDKKTKKIVNNESEDIVRMMNSEFKQFRTKNQDVDLYPQKLKSEIDEINDLIYNDINNGVYRAGFAKSQEAYDSAVVKLFQSLEKVENILSKSRFLVTKDVITEADLRLFVTLVRFDEVYNCLFKCNKKRIADYPNLDNYTRDVYQIPGIDETVNLSHIRNGYYSSMSDINKFGIIPIGPGVDFSLPHDRAEKFAKSQ